VPERLADIATLRQRVIAGERPRDLVAARRQVAPARAQASRCVVRWLDEPVAADAALPLAGVTVAHKDIFDLAGWRPGRGRSDGHADAACREAPVVARLREAGATQLATLAMAEHACGATAYNVHQPECLNPIRAGLALGGSSSGSAAAVAAGVVDGSLGTDTAGSVRIPAATCGLLGLKPTWNRLPTQGVAALAPTLDTVGLLARTPDDLQQLWRAASGPRAPHAEPAPSGEPTTTEAGSGMAPAGRVRGWLAAAASEAVRAALAHALSLLRSTDTLDELPGFDEATRLAEVVLHGEAAQVLEAELRASDVSPTVRAVALPGVAVPATWLRAAQARRAEVLRGFVQHNFASADVLLLPALATEVPDRDSVTPGAPGFSARALSGLFRFMGFANYLGLPALVFPVARDARGLPVCVQAIARPHQEDRLIALARACAARDPAITEIMSFNGS
jgi:aspartyl-tRNA(Asn)/glutamyl-tRNA(Gln) amidotransferase subunit A